MALTPIPYPWDAVPDANAQGADAIRGTDQASSIDDTQRKVVARTKSALVVAQANDYDLQAQIDGLPDPGDIEAQHVTVGFTTSAAEGDFVSPTDNNRVGVSGDTPPIGYTSAAVLSGADGDVTVRGFIPRPEALTGMSVGDRIYAVVQAPGWALTNDAGRDPDSPLVGVVVSATTLWLDFGIGAQVKFATADEFTTGTATDIALSPGVVKPELVRVEGTVAAQTRRIDALDTRINGAEGDANTLRGQIEAVNGLLSSMSVSSGPITIPNGASLCRLRVWGASGGGADLGVNGGAGGTFTVSGAVGMSIPGGAGGLRDPLGNDLVAHRTLGDTGVSGNVTAPSGTLILYRRGQTGGFGDGYQTTPSVSMSGYDGVYVELVFTAVPGQSLNFSGGAAGSGGSPSGVDGKRAVAMVEFYG